MSTSRPSNLEIARQLNRYASLMEIAGENPFRVRAVRIGAEAVGHLPEQISSLNDLGAQLIGIPGIGSGIIALLQELVDTGRISAIDALAPRAPAGLLDVIHLPGIGAKTASKLHQAAGITDLESLRAAVSSRKLIDIPGLGRKLNDRLEAGLAALDRRSGRHRLGDALPIARSILSALRERLPSTSPAELAGSARRWQETVANIDIVAVAPDAEIIRVIESIPGFSDISQDERGVRARHERDIEIRVYTVTRGRFGTELVHATGPEEHLTAIGFDATWSLESEEAVYAALGLPWIAPEFRQGAPELELVRSGAVNEVIALSDIRGELHCHSTWSDGHGTIAEMAGAAQARGYAFLGISDHSHSLGVANGLSPARLQAQAKEIRITSAQLGFPLFTASEVEVLRDGELDFTPQILDELDAVIVSTHSGLSQKRAELMKRLETAFTGGHVDILAHPSGRLIGEREPGDFDWPGVYQLALHHHVALEINADPSRLDLNAEHARQAIEAGCMLSLNCDAHSVDGFEKLEFGIGIARRAFVPRDRVINTWEPDRLRAWLSDPASR